MKTALTRPYWVPPFKTSYLTNVISFLGIVCNSLLTDETTFMKRLMKHETTDETKNLFCV